MNLARLVKHWTLQVFAPGRLLHRKYEAFKELRRHDKRSLELITDLEDLVDGERVDWARVESRVRALCWSVARLIDALLAMQPGSYEDLQGRFQQIEASLAAMVKLPAGDSSPPYTLTLADAAHTPEMAGGKAHTLTRLLQSTGIPGPRGFVITTHAFRLFIRDNGLRHRLDELLDQVQLQDWERLEELCREMTAMVAEGDIPPPVRRETLERLAEFRARGLAGPWALRSSAWREDGEASFAGQYLSVLNVAAEDIWPAYKKVLASKYTPLAVAYRIRHGLADEETPMATLALEMIDAETSGVVYTRSPETGGAGAPGESCVEVFALKGLGPRLVEGRSLPEVHCLSREAEPRLLSRRAAPDAPEEGTFLEAATARQLARWGMRLEGLTGQPQDMEWCRDKPGRLYLLQSRPLNPGTLPWDTADADLESREPDASLLLEGGVTASPGWGVGQVWVVQGEPDLARVPAGAVLVSPYLLPAFAGIIPRLKAVVAEAGSRASHFAMVAREYGVPVIVGARGAGRLLPPGETVTVDAGRGRVYRGEVGSWPEPPEISSGAGADPFFTRLHRVLELVTPLHLTDPQSPDFAAPGCRSLHDVVRFAHEKGMAEMFSLGGRHGRGLGRARRLATDLPLVMYLLDLEDGISPEAAPGKDVGLQLITSEPLRACWQGLSHPDVVWDKSLLHIDWAELDRVSAGVINLQSAAWASYAIFSRDYLHLVWRFGYHFAVLDTLAGEDAEANYIAFRFKGGGGGYENRLRRIQLIRDILEWAGFQVQTRGDLLNARFQRREAGPTLARLTLVGLLQGKTRLLDMALESPEQVSRLAADFKGRYHEYIVDP